MEDPVTLSHFGPRNDSSSASQPRRVLVEGRRPLRRTLAPPENVGRLLAWIDGARAATWPVEHTVLGLMALIGLALVLAIRGGIIAP
jgi:hypothetical protein